ISRRWGRGPEDGASTRRAARPLAARPRSTVTSIIAASVWTSIPGRRWAIAAGAIRTCCRISSGWSGGSARAISLGIPRNPDYNGAIQEGVSYAQRTIQNGLRVSAAKAFLHPARKRGNVDVRTHAHATQIVLEGKRAVGVRYMKGGRRGTPIEVRAAKEVILSGGSYNSPQLLQLSGIGSPELL